MKWSSGSLTIPSKWTFQSNWNIFENFSIPQNTKKLKWPQLTYDWVRCFTSPCFFPLLFTPQIFWQFSKMAPSKKVTQKKSKISPFTNYLFVPFSLASFFILCHQQDISHVWTFSRTCIPISLKIRKQGGNVFGPKNLSECIVTPYTWCSVGPPGDARGPLCPVGR